jgi:L-ascorbate metabolism protein UlaG (beta-lactamase superfamily)
MLKATFLGHAAFSLESDGTQLLIDPFLTGNPKAKAKPEDFRPDFIVLSHGHSDHVGDTVSIAKRANAKVIATFELAKWLGSQGLDVQPMGYGGWSKFPFGAVKFTQAIHSSSIIGDDGKPMYLGEPAGILLDFYGKRVYHAGDTALFSDMRLIGEDAPIDLACLPIGEHFVMGPKDAAKAVEFLKPKHVVPIHYGTFPVLYGDPKEFARLAEGKGAKISILEAGEFVEL